MREADGEAPKLATVVVPARNAGGTIGDCVRALQEQTMDSACYEIIVVDDASTDATGRVAAEAGACVIRQEKRRGPAAARNAGIRAARGELVCFTDADCSPIPEWLERLKEALARPEVVGCKGIYTTLQRSLVARFVQIEYEEKYDRLREQRYIDFIDTYSAAYRRDVLLANNGFDEIFPQPSVEDQELSFRLAMRGYKMVFQPEAVVEHRHVATLPGYFRKKFIIGYWKAQLVRRFPERAVKDSHTPQVMKVQMGLMALALLAAATTALTAWGGLALALILLAFIVTTVPFVVKAWPKDRLVALISLLLLALRALALGFGYTWGVLRPQPGFSGTQSAIGGLDYVLKRSLDVAGGLLGLAVTSIIGPFIAVAIKVDSPGPVFFRRERVGQGGERFTIYKFRSTHYNAEDVLEKSLPLEKLAEPVFKPEDDPRRTRVGRFLHRWNLDELPQFWNVFKGDMSLVGPRPEEARIVDSYGDWHRRRLSIKPGLTGPTQVDERADLSLDERVELELDYIENYSLWRDLTIIARTVPAVLRGQGTR